VGKINVVCLCDLHNLKEFFGEHFATDNPWVNLLLPEEISNPESIHHALASSPGLDDFKRYPGLRLVSCAGAGADALQDNPSLSADVVISRVIIAEQAQMIAGFAIGYIHGWQRRMWAYTSLQSAKNWRPINRTPPSAFPVGILGCGKIGGTLARTLQALGYPVTAYGSASREEGNLTILSGSQGLIELAKNSYAVVNLLPLTEDTRSLLSAEFFANMREDAILIHLGRGAHLVDDDLVTALDQGRPAIAALDVFMEEPLPAEHPFWEHEKIMLTPHVAGDADYRAIAQFIADGICQFENGNSPEGLVNRDRGY
jgi:glyoxylate/hydroxypyruvate reductase A